MIFFELSRFKKVLHKHLVVEIRTYLSAWAGPPRSWITEDGDGRLRSVLCCGLIGFSCSVGQTPMVGSDLTDYWTDSVIPHSSV